jgi:pimeloyl-ACP methyl ester carboxylesterase
MLIFIHGGVPGVTPYASGPHIWGSCLSMFDGETVTLTLEGDTVDAMLDAVKAAIPDGAHLVGHDLGGLLALLAACDLPSKVRSVTAVSSVAAAPTGDGVPVIALDHPPLPLWSRESQRWALERVSYSHHHIDDALLDACVDAATGIATRAPGRAAGDAFMPSLMAAKSKFFAMCRDREFPVPAQVIWGTHDPLGSFEQGLWLFRVIAATQKEAQFHAINRAGALPFREEPEAFHQAVSAFVEATGP